MVNLEDLIILQDFGKNDIYERLIAKSEDNNKYFIKKTHKSILEEEIKNKYFQNEVSVVSQISHPNIISFIEQRQILNDIFLIFEVARGGSLNDYFKFYLEKNNKPFPEEYVQRVIKHISEAIKYLHDSHIIYRNLTLDNTYINFENDELHNEFDILKAKFQIGNFHFSKILGDNELTHSFIGVPIYMDPNILFNSKDNEKIAYDFKADIWSLGSICFELLTGVAPFDGNDFDELVKNVKNATYKIPKSLNLSIEAVSFITGMLQYDPNKRFSIDDVIKHDFLTKKVDEFAHKDYEKFGTVNDNEIVLDIKIN